MQFPELVYDFKFLSAELSNGATVAYTDSADNKEHTLLFIHGLASYIPAWSKLIPLLENKFRCIAIDLPGYGKSSSGIHSGSMALYSETISCLIQELNLSNVSLVGHSMGGQIAITTTIKYPELVNKLIMLAPAGLETFTEQEKERLKRNNVPSYYSFGTDAQIRLRFEANFFNVPADLEMMIKDRIKMRECENFDDYCIVVANSFNQLLDETVFDKLNKIEQETLILFGLNDRLIPQPIIHPHLTPKSVAEKGASEFRNAKLVLIDKCGHFLQFEKPELVAGEIALFFSAA